MPYDLPPPLRISDLVSRVAGRLSRRRFIQGIPLLAAAAAACSRQEDRAADSPPEARGALNSDSRLDTALVRPDGHPPGSRTSAVEGADAVPFRRYDPTLPPLPDTRTHRVHWRATEVPVRIGPNVVVAAWTFEDDVPGPILHVRQGDTVEFTLTNEGDVPHSMDFHAAQVNPETAFRSVPRGESVSFTFRPRYPGAFMYHCGTAPVLMHIGTGMYGAIIVDPPEPLPPAREFVLVHSEYYLSDEPAADGIVEFDYRKMATAIPDY
ncbi:MAG: multicopper oxidase domain-containing protein, partial [Gemmatimonadota bacterium]